MNNNIKKEKSMSELEKEIQIMEQKALNEIKGEEKQGQFVDEFIEKSLKEKISLDFEQKFKLCMIILKKLRYDILEKDSLKLK